MKRSSFKKKVIFGIAIGAVILAVAVILLFTIGRSKISSEVVNSAENGEKRISVYQASEEHIAIDPSSGTKYVDNEVVLKTEEDMTDSELQTILEPYDGKISGRNDYLKTYQVTFDQSYTYDELSGIMSEIMRSSTINTASIDYLVSIGEEAYYPNDKEWEDSWGDDPEGNNWGVEAIRAPEMWEALNNHNTQTVNVGVLDSQFDTDHEDLRYEETFLNDYNYFNGEEADHGTHVSGTLAALFDNNKGIAGVSRNVALYGASYIGLQNRDVDWREDGVQVSVLEAGLTYLICIKECKVVNLSIHFGAETLDENNALINDITSCLKQYLDEGFEFLLVKASGNAYVDGTEPYNKHGDTDGLYYDVLNCVTDPDIRDRLIIVGSAELADGEIILDANSNFGDCVDVVAPGNNILSCTARRPWMLKKYRDMSGTSMAAPHVSGIAASIWSVNPNLSGRDVKNILCSTSTGSYRYKDITNYYTYPMVDAYQAVIKALDYSPQDVDSSSDEGDFDMYKKYLQILQTNEAQIKAYDWQNAHTGVIASIAFADIVGDEKPEMIVVQGTESGGNYVVTADLDIYSYDGDDAKQLYSGQWDVVAGGGFYYNLFQEKGEKAMYAWIGTGDEWWHESFIKFETDSGGNLQQKEIASKIKKPNEDYSDVLYEYTASGSASTAEEYNLVHNRLVENLEDVLIVSNADFPGAYFDVEAVPTAMDYEEAVAYLKSLLGEAEPETDGDAWANVYHQFVMVNQDYLNLGLMDGENAKFGLYDIDSDGVPELIIGDGFESGTYGHGIVLKYSKGGIKKLNGDISNYGGIFSARKTNNTDYPGLVTHMWDRDMTDNGGMLFHLIYYYRDGDELLNTEVATCVDDGEYSPVTDNNELFRVATNAATNDGWINMYSVSEIDVMGWDNFIQSQINDH